jgi:chromosome segregation ATPase
MLLLAMEESTLRRILSEVVGEKLKPLHEDMSTLRDEFGTLRGEFGTLRGEFGTLRGEFGTLRDELRAEFRTEIRASEERLAEGGRLQFRQLSELYRGTLERIENMERHVGERLDATRAAIEALRSSLERQDFRSDELARRITTLETRPPV